MPTSSPQKQISVRLAGVDAPECAHFGMPAQPYGEEAKYENEKKYHHIREIFIKENEIGIS